LRAALIVSELALAILLLTGAGLLLKSFARLMAVAPGFRAENVLTMAVPLPQAKYREPRQWRAFFEQALERIRALPSVRYAAATTLLPMSGSNTTWTFLIGGRPEPLPGQFPMAGYRAVTSDYFRAMGIPLLRGRHFAEQDREGAPFVVIINQAMARLYWPNEDPVGQRIRPGGASDWGTVVGVVGNIRFSGLDGQASPEMFWSQAQRPRSATILVIRTEREPAALASAVRAAIREVDPDQPVARIRTLERIVDQSVAPQRVTMLLLGAFAALALVLAGTGLYGVMSYLVAQRTHEIGLRMALGAQPGDVLRLVVRQGLTLALLGAAIGVGGALALTRLMSSLLFGVTTRDPAVFVSSPVVLVAVALAACFLPARRASLADPLAALRHE
jgi:putative ABC transport system permease protein